jgi:subfamily B ATP-binding cassette protein MsbA
VSEETKKKKKKINYSEAWIEAKDIIWRNRKRLLLGIGLMLVSRASGFVLPLSMKPLVDGVFQDKDLAILPWIVAAVAVSTVVQAITSFSLSQVLGVAAQRAIMELRKEVQYHVTRLPTSYFDSTKSGVLISRIMTDPEGIRNLVGTGLSQLVGGLVTAAAGLTYLFWRSWHITTIILLILATFGGVMAFAFARLRPLFRKRGEINAQVTGRLTETLGGIRVVKAYTAERREDIVFARGIHGFFRNVAQSMTGVSAVGSFATVVIGAVGITVMILGSRAVHSGEMTFGDLVSYIAVTALVTGPLIGIANIGTQITEAFAGLDRIREIRRMATESDGDAHREALGVVHGDFVVDNAWFEYNPGAPVLKGVSLNAPSGTTTALVGPSGSGKSTLIGIIMAFHYPTKGRVLVDGKDLSKVKLHDYRSQLGVVMQDNFLFEGTITDNIRFSKPHATMEEVRAAGRTAHCEEFVNGFEKGYETVVGERGVKLSGGQRQRVAIARAILAGPRILILDEATASLDSESEEKIQDGLRSLRKGRTSFVIAHRLSTIISSDQILVLDKGEIVERGTHAELLALAGRYKQLYDKQYRFEMNRFINPGEELAVESESA